jgi:hypothetical protein
MHTRFIKTLHLDDQADLSQSSCLVRAISMAGGVTNLFPNLRTLRWLRPFPRDITFFAHSRLTFLTIALPHLPESLIHTMQLRELVVTAQGLRRLHVVLDSTDSLSFWEYDLNQLQQIINPNPLVVSIILS